MSIKSRRSLRKSNKTEIRKIKIKCQKYRVFLNCGCCQEILYFLSEDLIKDEFEKNGLVINGKITDSTGYCIDGVDTFYGYEKL